MISRLNVCIKRLQRMRAVERSIVQRMLVVERSIVQRMLAFERSTQVFHDYSEFNNLTK